MCCIHAYADEIEREYIGNVSLGSMMKNDQFTKITITDALHLPDGKIALIIYAGSRGKFYRYIDYLDSSFNEIQHARYKLIK